MYVYETPPIDWFHGMTMLRHYIALLYFINEPEVEYFSFVDLFGTLVKCFMEVRLHNTYWEGDIRGDNIAISAIPAPDLSSTYIILTFKQDNNGTSYVVSDIEIPHLKDYLCTYKQKDTKDISVHLAHAITLTQTLMNNAMKMINNNRVKDNCVDDKKIKSEEKSVPNNKINLADFQKL